jgi:hypothetical protein
MASSRSAESLMHSRVCTTVRRTAQKSSGACAGQALQATSVVSYKCLELL